VSFAETNAEMSAAIVAANRRLRATRRLSVAEALAALRDETIESLFSVACALDELAARSRRPLPEIEQRLRLALIDYCGTRQDMRLRLASTAVVQAGRAAAANEPQANGGQRGTGSDT
jgi:hypothetical protein